MPELAIVIDVNEGFLDLPREISGMCSRLAYPSFQSWAMSFHSYWLPFLQALSLVQLLEACPELHTHTDTQDPVFRRPNNANRLSLRL